MQLVLGGELSATIFALAGHLTLIMEYHINAKELLAAKFFL